MDEILIGKKNQLKPFRIFWQKGLFGRSGFSAGKSILAERTFRPKILFPNLKWLFGQRGLPIIYYSSVREIIFSQENFVTTILLSNESALLL